jgi:hypothetical protein
VRTTKSCPTMKALMMVSLLALVAPGCGGSRPGAGDGSLPPFPSDAVVPPGSGGIEGSGGIQSSGGIEGSGGIQGSGGILAGTGGAPSTGGVPSDASVTLPTDSAISTGGISGQGGNTGTGGSTVVTCGEPGYACCTGNACKSGGCCVASLCVSAGGACAPYPGICANSACDSCGGPGQPCCGADPSTGSCTAPNTTCNAGTCAKCGDLGLGCCAGPSGSSTGVCTTANSICNNSLCVPCGTPGNACCPGNLCTSPGCCFNNLCISENTACGANAGTCQAGRCNGCGAVSQPCCSNLCYDGLLCKNSTCASCGGMGEACCPASTAADQCKPGTACTSSGSDGLCARCGTLGDICCAGSTCSEGCCAQGRCVSDTAACAPPPLDGGVNPDAPVSQCATGGAPCSALARFSGVQVVDGKDDEFCNVPSFELTQQNAGKVLIDAYATAEELAERAVARVGWNEAGIHAFIRVYDTTFTAAKEDTLWNGDSVELFFSTSTDVTGLVHNDPNTFHVIVSPPLAQSIIDTSSSGEPSDLPKAQYASGSDSTGYWVELNLPWSATAPTAGTQIKFDMQINASDGPITGYEDYTRDGQLILYLGSTSSSTTTCSSSDIQPFCDDRLWCTTTLQP